MKILTLVAGYIAGIAVAMKYRKDIGASRLPGDIKDSTLDNFIDEVVDIHRDVYTDAKKLYDTHFGDVKDFDDLKGKIEILVNNFSTDIEGRLATLKTQGEERKIETENIIEWAYKEKIALLDEAKKRALTFAGTALDIVEPWIAKARTALDTSYTQTKTRTKPASQAKPKASKKTL